MEKFQADIGGYLIFSLPKMALGEPDRRIASHHDGIARGAALQDVWGTGMESRVKSPNRNLRFRRSLGKLQRSGIKTSERERPPKEGGGKGRKERQMT